MSFEISGWNLNPNQKWYIKISDNGSNGIVKLFESESDAISEINLVASGTFDFGASSEAILETDEDSTTTISKFNSLLSYHLLISGQDSDVTKTYYVAPFVDLPEIDSGIYMSTSLINKRATYEINAHTHISKNRTIYIANHIPSLKIGDVCTVNSDTIGINTKTFINNITIEGTKDSLINKIETVEYVDLNYAE